MGGILSSLNSKPPLNPNIESFSDMHTAGLYNQGNFCYLNTAIKCLSSSTFYDNYNKATLKLDIRPQHKQLQAEFIRLINGLNNSKQFSPHNFLKQLILHNNYFKGADQKDCYTAMIAILDCIHDATRQHERSLVFPRVSINGDVDYNSCREYIQQCIHSIITDSTFVYDMFLSMFLYTYECTECHCKQIQFNIATGLGLDLKELLLHSIKSYCSVSKCNNYMCVECKKHTTYDILKIPLFFAPILILQIMRVTQNHVSQIYEKNNNLIYYPNGYELLSLSSFAPKFITDNYYTDQRTVYHKKYKLASIAAHDGQMQIGHYYAYIFNQAANRWERHSDTKIDNVQDISKIKEAITFVYIREDLPNNDGNIENYSLRKLFENI